MENGKKEEFIRPEEMILPEEREEGAEKEEAQVRKAVEELTEEGEGYVAEVGAKGPEYVGEMEKVTSETATEAREAEKNYQEEKEAEGEFRAEELEAAEGFVKRNEDKLKKAAGDLCQKLGIEINSEKVLEELTHLLQDEEILRKLEEEGVFDEDISKAAVSLAPLLENAVRSVEEKEGAEELSVAEKAKKIIIEILAETDAEKDPERIEAAGKLLMALAESGRIKDAKLCVALNAVGMAMQYEIVQRKISQKFRKWLEENRSKESEEQISEKLIAAAGIEAS